MQDSYLTVRLSPQKVIVEASFSEAVLDGMPYSLPSHRKQKGF